jgi:hypothetical protein
MFLHPSYTITTIGQSGAILYFKPHISVALNNDLLNSIVVLTC